MDKTDIRNSAIHALEGAVLHGGTATLSSTRRNQSVMRFLEVGGYVQNVVLSDDHDRYTFEVSDSGREWMNDRYGEGWETDPELVAAVEKGFI